MYSTMIHLYIHICLFQILFPYKLLQNIEYSSLCYTAGTWRISSLDPQYLALVNEWMCVHALLCPNLCDPMDCSPPVSSVHGILQARMLEWVVISFSRGSSQPRDWTHVSCIAGKFFTAWAVGEALSTNMCPINILLNVDYDANFVRSCMYSPLVPSQGHGISIEP